MTCLLCVAFFVVLQNVDIQSDVFCYYAECRYLSVVAPLGGYTTYLSVSYTCKLFNSIGPSPSLFRYRPLLKNLETKNLK